MLAAVRKDVLARMPRDALRSRDTGHAVHDLARFRCDKLDIRMVSGDGEIFTVV